MQPSLFKEAVKTAFDRCKEANCHLENDITPDDLADADTEKFIHLVVAKAVTEELSPALAILVMGIHIGYRLREIKDMAGAKETVN